MLLPPLPVHALDMLVILQVSLVGWDGLLHIITTSGRSWTLLRRELMQSGQVPPYGWLAVSVWILSLVLVAVFGATPTAYPMLRGIWFGCMLLLTIAPWWGLHG